MPQLIVTKGPNTFGEFGYNGDIITIGRGPSNDICLPDAKVSRFHAALVRAAGGGYFVRDLGSVNPTIVGGQPAFQKLLADGDVIHIGDYDILYSDRARAAVKRDPLRVVARKSDPATEGQTVFVHNAALMNGGRCPDKREILEELHKSSSALSPAQIFGQMMGPILKSVRADRGFAAVFADEQRESFLYLGITGLDENSHIEVTDSNYIDRLLAGNWVSEGGTILTPLGSDNNVTGFLCVDRTFTEAYSEEDVGFLMTVGAVLGSAVGHAEEAASDPDAPLPWGVDMIAKSAAMDAVLRPISEAAGSGLNVLILGESGTGKEAVARAIHSKSNGASTRFVARNCAALTESLAQTEIFGYASKSGIFGAEPGGAPGWFELANGGTLFLDEVHGLSLPGQDSLLRVLQDKAVVRYRGQTAIPVDVKVIAATDQDLEQAIERGTFRKPLYFRFGQKLRLPPLRQRAEEIPLLAHYFLDKYARQSGSRARSISHRAIQQLMAYHWPGNVRELENNVASAVSRNREVLFSWDFECQRSSDTAGWGRLRDSAGEAKQPVVRTMDEIEKQHILEALEATRGNITRSAELLGYKSRQTMLNKMARYGIPRNYGDAPRLRSAGSNISQG